MENIKVLVVEDNRIQLTITLSILRMLGVQAQAAVNGNEALSLAETTRYDLILMDCEMPELDGYDTTLRLRGEYALAKTSRIVALTGNAFEEEKRRCLEVGMNDYIVKPIAVEGLMLKLSRHIMEIKEQRQSA